jgi:hypothetical protein
MVTAPPPAARSTDLRWLLILLGCGGILAVGVVGAVLALVFGATWQATSGPADAVREWLADVKRGQVEQAHARLGDAYRGHLSLTELRQLLDAHPALADNADATFSSRTVSGDTAVLGGAITSTKGTRERVIVRLVNESGRWRITSLVPSPSPREWTDAFPSPDIPDN